MLAAPTFISLAAGSGYAIALGDINGDGKSDALVTDATNGKILVFLGAVSGVFSQAVSLTVGLQPSAIRLADLDSDGQIDIVVSNVGSWDVSFLRGRGGGVFDAEERYAVRASPGALAVGDLNADGRGDIVAVHGSDRAISLALSR